MNEQILAALAAQDPSIKPLLAAMNGGGDMSALLPLLMSMNSGAHAEKKSAAVPLPDDDAINATLKRLN